MFTEQQKAPANRTLIALRFNEEEEICSSAFSCSSSSIVLYFSPLFRRYTQVTVGEQQLLWR